MRARVIRGSGDGERWAGPPLDAAAHTASAVGGQFRAAEGPPAPSDAQFQQGHEEGLAKGYEEGLQRVQMQMREQLDLLTNLTAYARAPLAAIDEQIDDELVRFVLAITRQVVRREVRTDPQQIVAVVREARSVLTDVSGKLCIALHPAEAVLVRDMLKSDESLAAIEIKEDLAIARGGCTLTSDTSFVDAQIETRIARIAVSLLGDERAAPADEGASK